MIYVLSGGTKLFAAIGVTYPAGSTCTCSNGTKTLKAKNTSGQWVFAIPEAGTWTVTAGDKSRSVSITKEGQFESVNLAILVLFDSGDNVEVTGGWVGKNAELTVASTLKLGLSNSDQTFGKSGNAYAAKK